MTTNATVSGLTASLFVLINAKCVQAATSFLVDQQNTVGFAAAGVSAPDFLFGQSFTPSFNATNAIDLNVAILSRPAQMKIALLDGVVGFDGLQGAVIARTSTQTVLPQSGVEFSLTGVSITPAGGFSDAQRFPRPAAA